MAAQTPGRLPDPYGGSKKKVPPTGQRRSSSLTPATSTPTRKKEYTEGPYTVIEWTSLDGSSCKRIKYIPGQEVIYTVGSTICYNGPYSDAIVNMLKGNDFDMPGLFGPTSDPFFRDFNDAFPPYPYRSTSSGNGSRSSYHHHTSTTGSSSDGCGCCCGIGCLIAIVIACLGLHGMSALGEYIFKFVANLFA